MTEYVVESYVTELNPDMPIESINGKYADEAIKTCKTFEEIFEDETMRKEWAREIEQKALKGFYRASVVIK